MSSSLRRAQLLADTAFDLLMWNPDGDNVTWQERPITDRERTRVENLTELATAYAEIAGAETAQGMFEVTCMMMHRAGTDERPAQTGETGTETGQTTGERGA